MTRLQILLPIAFALPLARADATDAQTTAVPASRALGLSPTVKAAGPAVANFYTSRIHD
jgi:hypothetical protein